MKRNPLIIAPTLPGEYTAIVTDEMVPNVSENQYAISNFGRLFSYSTQTGFWRINTPKLDSCGYYSYGLSCKDGSKAHVYAHRLMCLAFRRVENCENLVVDHIDGIPYHNYLDYPIYNKETAQYELQDNLEFVTVQENTIRAYRLGLAKRQIPEDMVIKISDELKKSNKRKDIAEKLGVPVDWVEYIQSGGYHDITGDVGYVKRERLPNYLIFEIYDALANHVGTYEEIAYMFNVTRNDVMDIALCKNYKGQVILNSGRPKLKTAKCYYIDEDRFLRIYNRAKNGMSDAENAKLENVSTDTIRRCRTGGKRYGEMLYRNGLPPIYHNDMTRC